MTTDAGRSGHHGDPADAAAPERTRKAPAEGTPEATAEGTPKATAEDERRWARIRKWTFAGWLAALALIILLVGIPTDRGSMLLLVLTLLAIPCLGRGWAAYRRVLLDWLPFTAALIVYDYSRGIARRIGMPLHMEDIAAADEAAFGVVPSVWLQERFMHAGDPRWWDGVATFVYSTHFFATPVLAAVLWMRARPLWIAFVTRIIALSVAGLLTYILFPAAPPWYAAREGAIDPVIRGSGRGWLELGINHAGNLLQQGQLASNPVAAMPSLHTAFALIITLFLVRRFRGAWRWLLMAYPVLMGISLVYLGEHYVVDLVAGIVYAVAVDLAVGRFERRRAARKDAAAAAG
jgi:membrane-associated phospholipid phosphatase